MRAPDETPLTDELAIALRAYVESAWTPTGKRPSSSTRKAPRPSSWVLVFDTETTTDAGQSLRFGSYQVRNGSTLHEAGIFYAENGVSPEELTILEECSRSHDLKLVSREEFVDRVFYGIGYEFRATIVGLNLPFDISRIAIRHGSARGEMRGGFTFTLAERRPALQVKHLNQKVSLIRFAAPRKQRGARSERNRGEYVPVRRGHFVDVRTVAGALFSRSFSLDGLCKFLKVENAKLKVEEHGVALTSTYVDYAVRDVQATWECYFELSQRFERLGLSETPLPMAYSEASIGKACLRTVGVVPLRVVQPDFPPQMLANIMGGYFGGRSEVRIRRDLRQVVLCDFLSMYPTICTLMGLWHFVIADGMTWRDGTTEIGEFLESVSIAELLQPTTWPKLTALVRVQPEADIFPVRAKYMDEVQATIGLNYLSADRPLWFTLADCVASKLLTGKVPKIVEAIIFEAGAPQAGLKPISIAGNSAYRIDPYKQDFYKRLIELRQSVKIRRDAAEGAERESLDTEQNALKIAANATSYGILVEVNVSDLAKKEPMSVYTSADNPYQIESAKLEKPGPYFHPLLASLITGGARLMLAMTETLVTDQCLDWSFCDTDSMAIAKPHPMPEDDFYRRVDAVVADFSSLNPYEFGGSILQVEKVNFSPAHRLIRQRLLCWAISAKRYVLFNLGDDGAPVIRKASAHGLGHLKAPYDEQSPAIGIPNPSVKLKDMGVELWQHDLWWKIAMAARSGKPNMVDLCYHPALQQPAVSRYGATSPRLLDWFKPFNDSQPYSRHVKPFGFLYSLFAKSGLSTSPDEVNLTMSEAAPHRSDRAKRAIRPAALFDRDLPTAISTAFDRETGRPVSAASLKSFREVLAQFHMHPEPKFLNGDYVDMGTTIRRHVRVAGVRNIGKEADHWEEQLFLGLDGRAEIDHGLSPNDQGHLTSSLRLSQRTLGQRKLARKLGISRGTLAKLIGTNR